MRYLKIDWLHNFIDEPVVIYSELDEENWETRKVEVLRNGEMHYAAENKLCGNARLSKEPLPSDNEITSDSQFTLKEIPVAEFQDIWGKATSE